MNETLTIAYPVGGNLTGQTRQVLSRELYTYIHRGVIESISQKYVPTDTSERVMNYNHGTYFLTIAPRSGQEISRVRTIVDDLLIFHPEATIL